MMIALWTKENFFYFFIYGVFSFFFFCSLSLLSSYHFRKPDRFYLSEESNNDPHEGFLITRRMVSGFPFSSFFQGGNFDRTKAKGSRARQPLFHCCLNYFIPSFLPCSIFLRCAPILSISGGTYVVWKVRTTCDCYWEHLSPDAVFPSTERSFSVIRNAFFGKLSTIRFVQNE